MERPPTPWHDHDDSFSLSMDDDGEGSFIDDDYVVNHLVHPPSREEETPSPIFTWPRYHDEEENKELVNIINLVNTNIDVYNLNIVNFTKFINNLENQFNEIERNISKIFENVHHLIQQIIIVEHNYDMILYETLVKVVNTYYRKYVHVLENRVAIIWQYSQSLETAFRQYCWLLKKVSWMLTKGFLDYTLDDQNYRHKLSKNNAISNSVLRERCRVICGRVPNLFT